MKKPLFPASALLPGAPALHKTVQRAVAPGARPMPMVPAVFRPQNSPAPLQRKANGAGFAKPLPALPKPFIGGAAMAIQRASAKIPVVPHSPRASAINNPSGDDKWSSRNTVATVELKTESKTFGSMAVFSLYSTPDRSDMAHQHDFETITYRDKGDDYLHAEMLLVVEILTGRLPQSSISRLGVSRKCCYRCAIVLAHMGFHVDVDESYVTENWTDPYEKAGVAMPASVAAKLKAI